MFHVLVMMPVVEHTFKVDHNIEVEKVTIGRE